MVINIIIFMKDKKLIQNQAPLAQQESLSETESDTES